ncbi:uncharacterized protein A1O9_11856 [Exophiala aquamarina CBS 119918]|uniref:AB hydrolase-1 domain-containing protein n=1 Tax=Exophiala aquamarina CBS 119918 TaxID=1182545 RepID=A0A072NWI4_9EURO|nr:uncharacterized protein A1O9_11856 [Exophiala aquamarina CBS 119918]KEF52229.1 hypothetical protein A1O9_11856 [Exophiala aquamarina CBS 119918]
MSSVIELGKGNVFSTGRSSTKTFKDGYFDYNFAKFLGLATYSGAEIAECFETAARIKDGDVESWVEAWTSTARRVEAYADNAIKGGHKVSAMEAWLRATTYYQAAFFFTEDRDPRKAQLYEKHTTCFQSAGKLFSPPLEVLSIPYEGKSLFGYFLRVDDKPRPTVLIQMGADGSAEQMYFSGGGAAAVRRGYNALIFEGPGQTGTFMRDRSLNYRYDWEVPVGAVVNYALTRKEVDPEKIALIAYSMGGYFGPRAVAFEKRLAACICSGLVPSCLDLSGARARLEGLKKMRETSDTNYNHSQKYVLYEHMPKYGLNNGIDDIDKLLKQWEKLTLYGLEDKIACPLLVVQAAAEGEEQTRLAKEFFDKLPNPHNKFRLTTEDDAAEMHCQKGNAMLLHAIEFDWLDDVLGLTEAAPNGVA